MSDSSNLPRAVDSEWFGVLLSLAQDVDEGSRRVLAQAGIVEACPRCVGFGEEPSSPTYQSLNGPKPCLACDGKGYWNAEDLAIPRCQAPACHLPAVDHVDGVHHCEDCELWAEREADERARETMK